MEEKEKVPKDPENEGEETQQRKKKQKSKPKDSLEDPNDGIDRWKFVQIKEGDMPTPLLEDSKFATLFPKYREKYIKEVWTLVKKAMHDHGVKAELDLIEGSMSVVTTKKTFDPYIIIKARDVIKLLARSVPYQAALRVLEDETYCDVIKIRGKTSNKEKFVKRRQRLVGPRGNTLKALELLTNCYIMVQGATVSVIGHYKQIKFVRRIVEDCMNNIHPIYHIKELMIKKELMKDEKLKSEDWSRFLPNFKKTVTNIKKKKVEERKKRERALFPPPPTMRKEDMLIESGEYFLSQKEKNARKEKEKSKSKEKKAEEALAKKAEVYQAPEVDEEIEKERKKKDKQKGRKEEEVSLEEMKKKFGISGGAFKL
jgi:ribosomal RNA assembly protein